MSSRPSRAAVAVAVVASVVVLVAARGGGGAGGERAVLPAARSAAVSAVDASPSPDGTPAAAAVAFVAAADRLVALSPIGRRELLRGLVTERAYAQQVRDLDAQLEAVGARLRTPDNRPVSPTRLVWVEAPLTVRVERAGADRARAAVWTLSVFAAPELDSPHAAWRTVRLELVRQGGRWLVDDVRADRGPTPAVSDLALPDGFERFAEVASWSPLVRPPG